jgi:hypothetical protein
MAGSGICKCGSDADTISRRPAKIKTPWMVQVEAGGIWVVVPSELHPKDVPSSHMISKIIAWPHYRIKYWYIIERRNLICTSV